MATKGTATTKAYKGKGKGKGTGTGESTGKGAASKYTDPALRDSLKKKIKKGNKGGKKGEWSARKSQLLVKAYEKAGGGYTSKTKDKAAQHLQEWTAQEWQTRDGSSAREDEETARYLPEQAWQELTPEEAQETDTRKRQASRTGRQHVPNTPAAKEAVASARGSAAPRAPWSGYDDMTIAQIRERLGGLTPARLRRVKEYESAHANRSTLQSALDRALR